MPSILHKHRIKALQQGVESWDASPGTDICASYFSTSYFTSNQRALLCLFFVVVYLLPTMARGGQLKRRTTLSCLRFSIHAGMSTHSYSMSVSLRLAKRSGGASIRRHPFISVGEYFFFLTNPRGEFQPGSMKRKLNIAVIANWSRTVGNERNISCIYVSFCENSSIERQSNFQPLCRCIERTCSVTHASHLPPQWSFSHNYNTHNEYRHPAWHLTDIWFTIRLWIIKKYRWSKLYLHHF